MKSILTKTILLLTLATALQAATPATPAPAPAQGDTTSTILQARTGQLVELRLQSGDQIGGKVVSVGNHLVHLSALTGREMYEATVAISDISAVVVRSAGK